MYVYVLYPHIHKTASGRTGAMYVYVCIIHTHTRTVGPLY